MTIFRPFLNRETRRRLRGPEYREEREHLIHLEKVRRFGPSGKDPFWTNLFDKVGPVILQGLKVLAKLAVQIVAQDLLKPSDTRFSEAVELVMKHSNIDRAEIEDEAGELVERAFRELKDNGGLPG